MPKPEPRPAAVATGITISLTLSAILLIGGKEQPKEPTLAECLSTIRGKQFVDLTHAFEPGIPHWPGFPDEKRQTVYWYDAGGGTLGKGFFAQQFTHVGHRGRDLPQAEGRFRVPGPRVCDPAVRRKEIIVEDYLLEAAREQWPNILMVYRQFEEKRPVILYDVQEGRIYAYPYEDFKREMSPKSQVSLTSQYERAIRQNAIVVFVRDNENRRLVSFTFDAGGKAPEEEE